MLVVPIHHLACKWLNDMSDRREANPGNVDETAVGGRDFGGGLRVRAGSE